VRIATGDDGNGDDGDAAASATSKDLKARLASESGVDGKLSVETLTFLDTPGHAIFSSMRAKGSALADVVVLVVSAVDGVQPQTIESIKLAKKLDAPIVVAVNKCDIDGADSRKVLYELAEHGVTAEDLGGDAIAVEISALKRTGLRQLKEAVALMAEMLELTGDAKCPAEAMVVEGAAQKGVGTVLQTVVRRGTLNVGDWFVCGGEYGKVKGLLSRDVDTANKGGGNHDTGRGGAERRVKSAPPSAAVTVLGCKGVANLGADLLVVKNEKAAKAAIEERARKSEIDAYDEADADAAAAALASRGSKKPFMKVGRGARHIRGQATKGRWRGVKAPTRASEDAAAEVEDKHTLALVIKADVMGSMDAVMDYVSSLPTQANFKALQTARRARGGAAYRRFAAVDRSALPRRVAVVACGVGEVTEAEVAAAAASNAVVLAFNVKPQKEAAAAAKRLGVDVARYNVVYSLMDHVRTVGSATALVTFSCVLQCTLRHANLTLDRSICNSVFYNNIADDGPRAVGVARRRHRQRARLAGVRTERNQAVGRQVHRRRRVVRDRGVEARREAAGRQRR
jgi:translation initiation factor IF-2